MARHDFTDADRSEIHARYHRGKARLEEAKGMNNAALGARFGMSPVTVQRIITRGFAFAKRSQAYQLIEVEVLTELEKAVKQRTKLLAAAELDHVAALATEFKTSPGAIYGISRTAPSKGSSLATFLRSPITTNDVQRVHTYY